MDIFFNILINNFYLYCVNIIMKQYKNIYKFELLVSKLESYISFSMFYVIYSMSSDVRDFERENIWSNFF